MRRTNESINGIIIDAIDRFDVNSVAAALMIITKISITSLFPNEKNFSCKPIQFDKSDSF